MLGAQNWIINITSYICNIQDNRCSSYTYRYLQCRLSNILFGDFSANKQTDRLTKYWISYEPEWMKHSMTEEYNHEVNRNVGIDRNKI